MTNLVSVSFSLLGCSFEHLSNDRQHLVLKQSYAFTRVRMENKSSENVLPEKICASQEKVRGLCFIYFDKCCILNVSDKPFLIKHSVCMVVHV